MLEIASQNVANTEAREATKKSPKHVVFGKIDTEAEPQLAQAFNIRSIPTTIAFKEGIGVFMQPGALPEDALRDLVTKLGTLDMDEVRAEIQSQKAQEKAVEPPVEKSGGGCGNDGCC